MHSFKWNLRVNIAKILIGISRHIIPSGHSFRHWLKWDILQSISKHPLSVEEAINYKAKKEKEIKCQETQRQQ